MFDRNSNTWDFFRYLASVVAISVFAFFGLPALAASINTGATNAGQGSGGFSGYRAGTVTVSGGWENPNSTDPNTSVTGLSFSLEKDSDTPGFSSVTPENTDVYAQLMTAGGPGNWMRCSVVSVGFVSCVPIGFQRVSMAALSGVNVVAFDRDENVSLEDVEDGGASGSFEILSPAWYSTQPGESSGGSMTPAVSGVGANVKGDWVTTVSSAEQDTNLMFVRVTGVAVNATNTASLLDIAVGEEGDETIVVSNVAVGAASVVMFPLPVRVQQGQRVAVRLQSVVSQKSANVGTYLYSVGEEIVSDVNELDVLGGDPTTSRGVSLSVASGVYQQITAATDKAYSAFIVVPSAHNGSMSDFTGTYTLAEGAAGQEKALGALEFTSTAAETLTSVFSGSYGVVYSYVPAGSRVSVMHNTPSPYNRYGVTIIGVPADQNIAARSWMETQPGVPVQVASRTFTGGATVNTKGDWFDVIPVASRGMTKLVFRVSGIAVSGADSGSLLDIAVGPPGEENVVAADIAVGSANGLYVTLPVKVDPGERVSVRLQGRRANQSATVRVWGYQNGGLQDTVGSVDVLGTFPATSRGTAMTGAAGSYREIVASTSKNYKAVMIVPSASSATMAANNIEYVLAVGASGSETNLGSMYWSTTSTEQATLTNLGTYGLVGANIPAGSRLSVRHNIAANPGIYYVTLIGIPE
jgi:hypothetical protein